MKELVEYVARSLVDNKEAVTVEETVGPEATILELHVAPEDMGKVIGKQGRIRQGHPVCGSRRYRQGRQACLLWKFNKPTAHRSPERLPVRAF